MVLKITRLMLRSINCRRIDFLLFFSLYLIMAAGATEYIVSPAPGDEFGVSVAGEDVQILEDTVIPYWQFLLWLAIMQILSVIDILLFSTKLIFAILGFRLVDHSNAVGVMKRKNIYAFIKANPGICVSKIANCMDLNRGTLRHHLKILETKNMIEAHIDRGKVLYFQNNSTYGENEKLVISVLQNEITRKIISKILKEECNTNGDLALTTGISKSTISWYMKQLKESDLIEENKMGKSIIYNINPVYRDSIEKTYMKFFE
ncbi:ArsR family transcriptional regulator [Methanosarcina sp. 2.H.T.1A.6]|nr:ArsR family transcriptional regulator [Methanosarcina sp. 2.H.T.1A.3]KKG21163.1 ArsR family transcriptional regulator [Methanosarcina sp. 2.H.T.1A.8]KKG22213.1 ArsR family transcriptional regulator [Methanosarcina sp. 2.H.T.1A.15]KKG22323.1 ArsR family transcriptional regulator [Methanosarcina sp. 2.H.T.1A.6]